MILMSDMNFGKFILFFAAFVICGAQAALAGDFKIIGADELNKLLDKKPGVTVLVDARTQEEFREGHLPGAINVPPDKVSAIGSLLPKDRAKLVVFYCRGYD